MLLSEFIASALAGLESLYPRAEARSMVSILVCERLGVQSWTHIANPSFEVPEQSLAQLEADLQKLLASEPLQYVLGYAEFYGRRFRVTKDVLIPRPETELLVDTVLQKLKSASRGCDRADDRVALKILDLCTGSGCIAWTLALEPVGAHLTAIDISQAALAIARSQFSGEFAQGASGNSIVSGREVTFIEADVLDLSDEGLSGTHSKLALGQFDVIVSNPPYVMEQEKALMRSNVLDHEPALALFVPDDDPLIFYRAIAHHASRLLSAHGWGIVEINTLLAEPTAECFRQAGLQDVTILPALSGKPRFVSFSAGTSPLSR